MFKSLINFEFIFVCGMRKCSNFIDLHAAGQLSQHHFLKRMSFPHCIFLPPLAQINWPQVQVYFWAFSPVPLIHASVFVSISHRPDCCRKAPGVLLTWCCKLNPKPPNAHSCPPRYMPKKSAWVHWKMFIEMYMSASITIAPNWKQPRCPSWGKRINKLWQIPTAENHSAVIRNELLLTCKTRLDFKNITLNKRGLKKEYITYDSIYLKFKNKISNGWWEKNTIVWGAWGGLSWGHKNVMFMIRVVTSQVCACVNIHQPATFISSTIQKTGASHVVRVVKNSLANAGDVRDTSSIPGWGRSPGGGLAPHFSILAWRIPWPEEPGRLQSIGSQRVRHDWSKLACMHAYR